MCRDESRTPRANALVPPGTGAIVSDAESPRSVYVSVYVLSANTANCTRELRQTETRNLWFGCMLPELWGFPARLWIRRVLVRAQEGQFNIRRRLSLAQAASLRFRGFHA
jgi:hypothetical protein